MAMSRSFGATPFTTRAPIEMVPAEISSRPAIMRSSVDLPQPEGVAHLVRFAGGGMRRLAEDGGIHVLAARENQSSGVAKGGARGGGIHRRKNNGHETRSSKRVGVGLIHPHAGNTPDDLGGRSDERE